MIIPSILKKMINFYLQIISWRISLFKNV